MSRRIVLLGATGLTGRLTAAALVRAGASLVLAGRNRARLAGVARGLGGTLPVRVADVEQPSTLGALLDEGEVLVTTVGPFARFGDLVARAGIDAGAHYIDSAGEPSFTRRVFEVHGPDARSAGLAMLPAFATEWVLGNVAGGLALEHAGPSAVRVDTGYFLLHAQTSRSVGLPSLARGFGGASLASGVALLAEPGFAWRNGRLGDERFAERLGHMDVGGRRLAGLSTGGTEHISLPRTFPQLREVNVYLGWFGRGSAALLRAAPAGARLLRAPALARGMQRLLARVRGAPSGRARGAIRSLTVGAAYDDAGRELARVVLEGPDLYTLTAELLAWAATRVADDPQPGAGALAPVEAFGLPALRECCVSAGVDVQGPRAALTP